MKKIKSKFYISKLLLAFLVLLLNIGNSQSQDTRMQKMDIAFLDSTDLENGIYSTFQEFLSNSPSSNIDLKIERRSFDAQNLAFAKLNVLKYYDDSTKTYKRFMKPIWGVCIDGNVYIKFTGKFLLLLPMGKYSYFVNEGVARDPYQTSKSYEEYVIDLVSGEIWKLTVKNMKIILMNEDLEIYEMFKDEKMKNEKLRKYINRINQKYIC